LSHYQWKQFERSWYRVVLIPVDQKYREHHIVRNVRAETFDIARADPTPDLTETFQLA